MRLSGAYTGTAQLTEFALKQRLMVIALLSLLGWTSAVPAPSAGTDMPPAGIESAGQQLPITTRELYLEDSRRQKTVPVRITFPQGDGPFPVIIFSHGLFGSRDSYSYLAEFWAQHGYACIQPSHDDSIRWMRERGKTPRLRQMLKQQPEDKTAWINRVGDISFIIDSLPLDPELAGKFDTHRIGVGGHSYGAYTSMLIGGARVPHQELAPKIDSLADSRVKAIIAMSPQGIRIKNDAFGFDDKRSFTVNVPAMYMTGDRDQTGWSTPASRAEGFKYTTPGSKYFVSINGANHMTFSGRVQDEPANGRTKEQRMGARIFDLAAERTLQAGYGDDEAHRRLVEEASTLFLDAYVKGNASARSALEHGALTSMIGKAGVVQSK
jgi:predicted dienelactone hydrolase